jgi:ubiquinone/menaquinone biosynthesis C-methylase UbiE
VEEDMVDFLGKVDANYLDTLKAAVLHEKERSYDALALEPGGSVLEVGCGPATDTIALAGVVGPTGTVVGIDFDPEMVAQAEERTRVAGLGDRVSHQVADATTLPFDDATFDACRSERVFQHVPDPAAVLAEMTRVTRPGGRVVVFDTDHATVVVDSIEPEITERLMRFRLDTLFTNPGSGRQLYRLFREASLREVGVEPRALASLDLGFARIAGDTEKLGAQALAAGVVTEEELGRWNAALERAAADGTFFCSWTMMLAVGTKA